MRIAILKFKQVLKSSDAKRLEKIWRAFCAFDETHKYPTFKNFEVINYDREKEIEKRKLALDHIQEMLDLARVK